MATPASAKKKRFKLKAQQKGFKVTVTHPGKMNDAGTEMNASTTVTYSCLENEDREIKYRIMKQFGIDNQENDSFKALLFPWDAVVHEGDELKITNIDYKYQVTSADNPFQVGSETVYWQVQCTRKQK